MTVKLYADRDAMELDSVGGYYCKHVNAMTIESLHRKGDIAAELGWRDMQIDTLKAEIDEARGQVVGLAVELSVVEAIHTECVFITDELYEQCPQEVQKVIRSLAVMQMPSAKEAIANWQAQGVDKFAQKFCESTNMDFACNRGFYKGALEFAVSLRKGATDEQ